VNTLADVLLGWSSEQPQADLFISPDTGRCIRYGELHAQTLSLAGALMRLDVRPGDHVGLLMPNGIQTSRLFLSIMASGRVVTPFNLLSHREQLAAVIRHSDCRIILHGPAQAALLADAIVDVGREVLCLEVDPDVICWSPDSGPDADLPAVAADQPALLMYTSGTTGMPKGVRLTHRNLIAAASAVGRWHDLTRRDRVMSSLPIYHINGQSIATVTPFLAGSSIVAPQRFSTSQWWPAVCAHGCTWINMVPTIIAYLLQAAEASGVPSPQELRHVRFGRSASAPLPPEHHRAFEERFGIPVIEAMGMTESASVVFCNPHDDRRRYGSPGLPCGVEAKVIDADGRPLGDGQAGEICLRGDNVMSGYYKSDAETARAFDGQGWLRTGDLGMRDADGFYFITGRLKELIIKGGENIAPREIDEILLRHPAVLDAACTGIPDVNYGQEILACIVLREGAVCSEGDIRVFCQEHLGRYKTPKSFHFLSDLPRGPSGKVQRLKLVEWVASTG
jgi:acyl-CoA synthetase (AMP-forming)/AMP-acid ligase II